MEDLSTIATALTIALAATVPVRAEQQSQSTRAAAALTSLLDERKLEAIAARDPEQPDRFIAALFIPGSQLLVVSAAYPAPAVLEQLIAEAKYRDVYIALHDASTRDGRFFVMDLQADGLRRTRNDAAPFDIVYENAVHQISYDGDWKRQKLTEAEYNERFNSDDARYARMLTVLTDALNRSITSAAMVPKVDRERSHCRAAIGMGATAFLQSDGEENGRAVPDTQRQRVRPWLRRARARSVTRAGALRRTRARSGCMQY
jgi:hypothetical protein